MVAADTTRTKFYMNELIKNKLLPNYVLLLLNNNSKLLPGQKDFNTKNDLICQLKGNGIKYDIASNSNINSDEAITSIANRSEQVFIFSGFGGVLLKGKILDIGKKFLHIHLTCKIQRILLHKINYNPCKIFIIKQNIKKIITHHLLIYPKKKLLHTYLTYKI